MRNMKFNHKRFHKETRMEKLRSQVRTLERMAAMYEKTLRQYADEGNWTDRTVSEDITVPPVYEWIGDGKGPTLAQDVLDSIRQGLHTFDPEEETNEKETEDHASFIKAQEEVTENIHG